MSAEPILVAHDIRACIRRARGGRRRALRGSAWQDHGADRAQRRRQDDAVQRPDRIRASRCGHLVVRRRQSLGQGRVPHRPRRHGPHIPDPARAGADDRARERQARAPRTSQASGSWPRWRGRRGAARIDEIDRRARSSCSTGSAWRAKRDDYAGTLSGGQRKLLELGRALMADPHLVMLDEPTAGVNPALTRAAARSDHAASATAGSRSCSWSTIWMSWRRSATVSSAWPQGAVIAEGTPAEVVSNPAVIDAYLGTHHGDAAVPKR